MCKTKVLLQIIFDLFGGIADISTGNGEERFASIISNTLGGRRLSNLIDESKVSLICARNILLHFENFLADLNRPELVDSCPKEKRRYVRPVRHVVRLSCLCLCL